MNQRNKKSFITFGIVLKRIVQGLEDIISYSKIAFFLVFLI